MVFTPGYRVAGDVEIRNPRLSDYLNSRTDVVIPLTDASLARHERPQEAVPLSSGAVVPKRSVLLAFEEATPTGPRPDLSYVAKERHGVMLLLDRLIVRGEVHAVTTAVEIDVAKRVAMSDLKFLPVTNVSVRIPGGEELQLAAAIVNVERIHFTARF